MKKRVRLEKISRTWRASSNLIYRSHHSKASGMGIGLAKDINKPLVGSPSIEIEGQVDRIAYAISVHKSQGSEYPAVVLPLLSQHYLLLQRNLIYTAVTRGKRLVVIMGSKKALAIGIRNAKVMKRYTFLAERLVEFAKKTSL